MSIRKSYAVRHWNISNDVSQLLFHPFDITEKKWQRGTKQSSFGTIIPEPNNFVQTMVNNFCENMKDSDFNAVQACMERNYDEPGNCYWTTKDFTTGLNWVPPSQEHRIINYQPSQTIFVFKCQPKSKEKYYQLFNTHKFPRNESWIRNDFEIQNHMQTIIIDPNSIYFFYTFAYSHFSVEVAPTLQTKCELGIKNLTTELPPPNNDKEQILLKDLSEVLSKFDSNQTFQIKCEPQIKPLITRLLLPNYDSEKQVLTNDFSTNFKEWTNFDSKKIQYSTKVDFTSSSPSDEEIPTLRNVIEENNNTLKSQKQCLELTNNIGEFYVYKKQFEEEKEKSSHFQKQFEEVDKNNKNLENELQSCKNVEKQLKDEITSLMNEIGELYDYKEQLDVEKNKSIHFQKQLEDVDNKNKALKKELQSFKTIGKQHISILKRKLSSYKEENKKLRKTITQTVISLQSGLK